MISGIVVEQNSGERRDNVSNGGEAAGIRTESVDKTGRE